MVAELADYSVEQMALTVVEPMVEKLVLKQVEKSAVYWAGEKDAKTVEQTVDAMVVKLA